MFIVVKTEGKNKETKSKVVRDGDQQRTVNVQILAIAFCTKFYNFSRYDIAILCERIAKLRYLLSSQEQRILLNNTN